MSKLSLGVIAMAMSATACAPAPLYSANGTHKGAATQGEIPRDARGEPVWAAIRPTAEGLTPTRPATPPEAAVAGNSRPPKA